MKCPDCLQKIHKTAEVCPHCGVDLGGLRARFSDANSVVENGLQDSTGILRKRMRKDLEKAVAKCQKQFANLQIALAFVALREGVKVEEYGFWLVNDGVFKLNAVEQGNEAGRVVVVVEVNRKLLGMSYGYLLDEFIAEGESFDVLAHGHASFLEGDYVRGAKEILRALRAYLRVVHRRAVKGRKVNP